MRFSTVVVLLFLVLPAFAQKPDTIQVITHNKTLVTTNPSTGENSFPAKAVFPAKTRNYRKVTLYVTLGSPDTLPTAHWDYCDHIYLKTRDKKSGKETKYELSRMLTPYGSIFDKGWSWEWQSDITDFSMLLHDNVTIEYIHSGYEPKTVGWALTIRFEFIMGSPAAKSLSITKLWEGSFKYGDPANDFNKQLTPIRFKSSNKATFARIRIQQTGHGMDEPKGCSEFCSRYRDIKFDNLVVDRRTLWKKCGDNPLYPQGGTWIYNRGYWCPGYLQQADQIDVMLKGKKHDVDIEMEPYTATANIQANEQIASYLIQYEKPENKYDVAIDKILSPTDDKEFSRSNPVCSNPRIVIRNLGSELLHSALITFGTNGSTTHKFTWHGSLRFNETAEVELPKPVKYHNGLNKFTVNISQPNDHPDAWDYDNTMTTKFTSPLILPNRFIVQYQTNNKPKEDVIDIINAFEGVVYNTASREMKPNTLYNDTISLDEGCYELFLHDSGGDGLEFWYEPEQGSGFLRLLDMKGRLLYNFESDCGNGQHLAFHASKHAIIDTTINRMAFMAFPLRVKDKITFSVLTSKPIDAVVLIRSSENEILEKHEYLALKNGQINLDLEHLPAGRYFFEVQVDGVRQYKKRFNKD